MLLWMQFFKFKTNLSSLAKFIGKGKTFELSLKKH